MNTSVLIKKEWLEYVRNKKIISLLLLFAFFGFMSPLTAYFIPEIMDYFAESQNLVIQLPPPTYQDALMQYIKNISQLCVFILILMHMGIVSNEKEKGTAVFLLVKPVKRVNFILAKFIAMCAVITISIMVSALCAGFYTYIFFDYINIPVFIIQNILLLLYITCILSITLMFSTIAKSPITAGILSFFIWISFTLFAQMGKAGLFSPDNLITNTTKLTSGADISLHSIFSSLIIIIFCMGISFFSFSNWEAQ